MVKKAVLTKDRDASKWVLKWYDRFYKMHRELSWEISRDPGTGVPTGMIGEGVVLWLADLQSEGYDIEVVY